MLAMYTPHVEENPHGIPARGKPVDVSLEARNNDIPTNIQCNLHDVRDDILRRLAPANQSGIRGPHPEERRDGLGTFFGKALDS
jgi:hypothetical protein